MIDWECFCLRRKERGERGERLCFVMIHSQFLSSYIHSYNSFMYTPFCISVCFVSPLFPIASPILSFLSFLVPFLASFTLISFHQSHHISTLQFPFISPPNKPKPQALEISNLKPRISNLASKTFKLKSQSPLNSLHNSLNPTSIRCLF